MIENIEVSEKTLNEIKTIIGYPIINEEFSFIMDDDAIKNYAIAPAMETFFTYFPVITPIEYVVTGGDTVFEVDVPDNTLGIMRQQFVSQSVAAQGASLLQQGMFYGNPFYSGSQVISKGSYGLGGNFGTPFGYGKELFTYQNKFYNKSLEASNKAYYVKFDEVNNKILCKSSIPGVFYFEVGTATNDVEEIPLRRRQAFIKYAQGMLAQKFVDILSLSESDLPSVLDKDALADKAERYIEESLTYFREASSFPVMR